MIPGRRRLGNYRLRRACTAPVAAYAPRVRFALLVFVACKSSGGGGDDGPAPDAAVAAHTGSVFIQSYDGMNVPGTPTRGGQVSAGFYTAPATCTTMQTIGPCTVRSCPAGSSQGAFSAGTISISGAAKPLSLVPGADKVYTPQTSTTPLFAGGETITFAATGADVPAFTLSVTAPTKGTITAPAKPAAGALLGITRAQDFSVSWNGGGSGTIQVFLTGPGNQPALFCTYPASAGSGKVPTAALMTMAAGMGSFAMSTISEAQSTAGDWAVLANVYFNAVWPDAALVSGGSMLQ